MRNPLWTRAALAILVGGTSGCGLLADAFSDALRIDMETDILPRKELGKPPVQPLAFRAEATHLTPTYSLPEVDTKAWGPIIYAHNKAVDAGATLEAFELEVSNLTLDSNRPVRFVVTVSSKDGKILRPDGGEPATTPPASCTFTMTPGTDDAEDLGARMGACLSDWVRDIGIPNQLHYSVTTSYVSVAGQLADGEYTASHDETMLALNDLEEDCYERRLKVDADVVDNIDMMDFDDLSVESIAASSETVIMVGWGVVVGADGRFASGASAWTLMEKDVPHRYVYKDDQVQVDDFGVGFYPLMPEWMPTTLRAAVDVAKAELEDGEPRLGVYGCYTVFGASPRTGYVEFKLKGIAFPKTEAEDE